MLYFVGPFAYCQRNIYTGANRRCSTAKEVFVTKAERQHHIEKRVLKKVKGGLIERWKEIASVRRVRWRQSSMPIKYFN
jgi:hypothetical protein